MKVKLRDEQRYDAPVIQDRYTRRVLVAVGITLAFLVLLFLAWQVIDVLLIVFGGILFAVFLRSLSHWLSQRTPLSESWSLFVVVALLTVICVAGLWLFTPELTNQFNQLIESLPQSLQRVREYISTPAWGGGLLGRLPSVNEVLTGENVMSNVTTIFSTTFGILINLLIIIAIGIYAAADPHLYVNGFVRLFPVGERARIREVLEEVHSTLQRWLVGRLVSMVVIGTLTGVGLWLLGIPLAPTLGLLAAFTEFVPYIGPILSVVPAALLGLLDSPTTALYVILLYLGIQLFESYILTPLVEQQAVSIPPALTITVQLLAGVLIGGVGLLFATPLTAAVMVLIEGLYIEDTLDE